MRAGIRGREEEELTVGRGVKNLTLVNEKLNLPCKEKFLWVCTVTSTVKPNGCNKKRTQVSALRWCSHLQEGTTAFNPYIKHRSLVGVEKNGKLKLWCTGRRESIGNESITEKKCNSG